MRHKLRGLTAIIVISGLLTLLLVACGELSPSPTSLSLPTSTSVLSTLPIPPTSNGQPTAPLSLLAPSVQATAVTAIISADTPTVAPIESTVTVATGGDTTLPSTFPNTDTVGLPPTAPLSVSTNAVTNTPDQSVPTANTQPPTVPIGISPGIPVPTVPIGISPGIVDNTSLIYEQRFNLDLNGFTAEASLEYPKAQTGPFATILMFQPYGLYDLDATVSTSHYGISSRNYKLWADQLALRGFAVIRYTKRGYDSSGENQLPAKPTPIEQLISDGKLAYQQIQTNPMVDPRQIILMGEDEGAVVAMRLAQQQSNVAGLILIAPITDPRQALHYQTVDAPLTYAVEHLDGNKDGKLSAQELGYAPPGTYLAGLQDIALDGTQISHLLSTTNNGLTDIKLELKPYLQKTFEAGPTSYPERTDYLTALFKLGDNTDTLAEFKKPVLILQGGLDQQVPLTQSYDLDNYLSQQGNNDHTLVKYPKLGHSLYKLDKGGSDLFGPIDVNVAPPDNPINDTGNWLTAHFK